MRTAFHALVGLAAFLGLGACNGTAVFDAVDPDACAPGHGCPMAACRCEDGAWILDTTCELGECLAVEQVCRDRCAEAGGPVSAFASEGDVVPLPACETFCDRLRVNDCELGCDGVFSGCVEATTCDPAAEALWACLVGRGAITCGDDLAVRIDGCEAEEPGLCTE